MRVAEGVEANPGPAVRIVRAMVNVLSSRILLRPTDLERSRSFYRDDLGLAVYREFGTGPERGTVFFLGGGFLEVSGRCEAPPAAGQQLWLQVADVAAAHAELAARGVTVLREPRREPWGLVEMWIEDPDGLRIAVVEVPEDHPLRHRP
ncbi:VOC family protein [Streptomyces thermolineatus]|uniref:VOC family protein n=2 Tax=Streptomyces TaxID=1883 RepID=A0ABN3KXC1_9ACTN